MFRVFIALTAICISVNVAAAQVVQQKIAPLPSPQILINQQKTQLDQIQQLQKEMDRIFRDAGLDPNRNVPFNQIQKELDRLMLQPAFQPGLPQLQQGNKTFFGAGMAWGGAHLDKVNKQMQEELGLPEKEGLVVNRVEPNSAAEKAGVKLNDILVRVGDTAVPSDFDAFSKIVKDQKPRATLDLVVVRNGSEQTLKGARMPDLVQLGVGDSGPGGLGGKLARGGFGGKGGMGKNGLGGIGGFPGRLGGIRAVSNSTTIVNGATITRRQDGDDFSATYSKDELKINVNGKFDNGVAKLAEITVQDGKVTKGYTDVKDVPEQYQPILRQIIPSNVLLFPTLPNLQNLRDFPGLPVIPGIDK